MKQHWCFLLAVAPRRSGYTCAEKIAEGCAKQNGGKGKRRLNFQGRPVRHKPIYTRARDDAHACTADVLGDLHTGNDLNRNRRKGREKWKGKTLQDAFRRAGNLKTRRNKTESETALFPRASKDQNTALLRRKKTGNGRWTGGCQGVEKALHSSGLAKEAKRQNEGSRRKAFFVLDRGLSGLCQSFWVSVHLKRSMAHLVASENGGKGKPERP